MSGRDSERARELEEEEREDHRAGAVHEGGCGEQPDFAGESFQATPGIHGVRIIRGCLISLAVRWEFENLIRR